MVELRSNKLMKLSFFATLPYLPISLSTYPHYLPITYVILYSLARSLLPRPQPKPELADFAIHHHAANHRLHDVPAVHARILLL